MGQLHHEDYVESLKEWSSKHCEDGEHQKLWTTVVRSLTVQERIVLQMMWNDGYVMMGVEAKPYGYKPLEDEGNEEDNDEIEAEESSKESNCNDSNEGNGDI